jgi:alpha-glucosidase
MTATRHPRSAPAAWWRDAVIYEIYVRSFADGNGDGVGDIPGMRSRLPYLADLGVDAIWITPWYRSPMADGGYDVEDHRAIDPLFGTLADAERLIEDAHGHGLRVILDVVPNHTSIEHPWFKEALAAGRGSPERARYWFRRGRGTDGALPPNDWGSVFGGPAWTRVAADEWYLHLFGPEQPDLNWANPEVRAEYESILRFWFDRGVDGFRIDVAHGLSKDAALPDLKPNVLDPHTASDMSGGHVIDHPHWDRDEVHDVYRSWRRVADSYSGAEGGARIFVAEAWRVRPRGLSRYVRPDELHTAFNFDFLRCPWDAGAFRSTIDDHLSLLAEVAAPATWVLATHDLTGPVTRYGLDGAWTWRHDEGAAGPVDVELGTRRARAAALLMLALPGTAYIYQGEELGLPEVRDLPEEVLQDPLWRRSGHTIRGRDGVRVPLPWSDSAPALGFGRGEPWLPQPDQWRDLTVEAQLKAPDSMLSLYRDALRLRHANPALGDGELQWLDAPEGVLTFAREPGFRCMVNLSTSPVPLPIGQEVVNASGPLDAAHLPSDTAAWLVGPGRAPDP